MNDDGIDDGFPFAASSDEDAPVLTNRNIHTVDFESSGLADRQITPISSDVDQLEAPSVPVVLADWTEYLLFVMIGLTSWLLVNGVFTQLAVFFQLPGGERLPSYISLCIQLTNIGPLLYVLLMPRLSHHSQRNENISMIAVSVLGVFAAFFLAALWETSTDTAAVGLLFGSALAGLVGSMSVVVFFPFASLWGTAHTAATSTGMGLTSLVASIISIIQQPGQTGQLFSTSVYFALLGCIQLLCLASLCVVLFRNARDRRVSISLAAVAAITDSDDTDAELLVEQPREPEYTWRQLLAVGHEPFLNQIGINTLYYFLKSIINYSVRNYPHSDVLVFWLNAAAMLMDAFGRFSTTFLRIYSINLLSFLHFCFWSVLTLAACMTKEPLGYPWGGWLIIAINAVYVFSYTFEDTSIFQAIPKRYVGQNRPMLTHQLCRFTGISNQIGSFTGAVVSFCLVEFAPLFSKP